MKSLEEIKNKVAVDNWYENWEHMVRSKSDKEIELLFHKCMKEAQKEILTEISHGLNSTDGDYHVWGIMKKLIKEIDNQ